jgi:hypothetical protein
MSDNRFPKTPGMKAALKRLEADPALRDESKAGWYIRVGRQLSAKGKLISGPHPSYEVAEEIAARTYRGMTDGRNQWAKVERHL